MPKKVLLSLNLFVVVFLLLARPVYAVNCAVSSGGAQVTLGQTADISFGISNTDSESITTVEFENPATASLEFVSGNTSGWTASVNGNRINFSGGSIAGSASQSFTVQVRGLLVTEGEVQIDGYASSGGDLSQCYASSGVAVVEQSQEASASPSPSASSNSSSSSSSTSSSTSSSSSSSTTASPTPTPKPTPKPDTLAPLVLLDNDFSKPFTKTPEITGSVSDRDNGGIAGGVRKVEYSIDDGKNWQPVENTEKGEFSFTPAIFEDGNYQIKVRAFDPSGNTGYSSSETLVIDRLPPQVGGSTFSTGPLILTPGENGGYYALPGMNIKVTLSSIGGATEIKILTQGREFNLNKNPDNGLWSEDLTFEKSGVYNLQSVSLDGAGNRTEKNLNPVIVLEKGKVEAGDDSSGAKIEVFYRQRETNSFVLWDGSYFNQQNPQQTIEDRSYNLILPPGVFYIQVKKFGFKTLKTEIFTVIKTTPITTDLKLNPSRSLSLGGLILPLPDFSIDSQKIDLDERDVGLERESLEGKSFPIFELESTEGPLSVTDLYGKDTLITFINTFLPDASEQALSIEKSKTDGKNLLVVLPQQTLAEAQTFAKRGGYKVLFAVDPDGKLVEKLGLNFLPAHFFLDRKGVVIKEVTGLKSASEIREIMD